MHDLFRKGHIYMNPLSCFKSMEKSRRQADPAEGAVYSRSVDGWTLEAQEHDSWRTLGATFGTALVHNEGLEAANVYCLHARTEADFGIPFDLSQLDFGEAFVLFLNPGEFLRRLGRAAKSAGHHIEAGFVDYVDPLTHKGPIGAFRKFSQFSEQKEFRVAAIPGTGSPLSLFVDDLSDIAILGETSKRLRLDPR